MEKTISDAHRRYGQLLTDFANAKTSDDAAHIFFERVKIAFNFSSHFLTASTETFPSLKDFTSSLTEEDIGNFELLKLREDDSIEYPVYQDLIDEFGTPAMDGRYVMTHQFSGIDADVINNIVLTDYREGSLAFSISHEGKPDTEVLIEMVAYSDAIRHLIPIDSATPFRRKPPPDSDRFRHP